MPDQPRNRGPKIILGLAALLIVGNLIFLFDWSVPFSMVNLSAYLNMLTMVLLGFAMVSSLEKAPANK